MKRNEAGNIALPVRMRGHAAEYSVRVGSGLLTGAGDFISEALPTAKRILLVSNKKVFRLYGEAVRKAIKRAGISPEVHLIGDGERYKTLRTAEGVLAAAEAAGLTRTDAVVSLGGGVVGDIAGFAAAIYLRGIPHLLIPTTLVAMIDASVGGKTGVNSREGKNRIGAFYQPAGVLADPTVLKTLDRREFIGGLCEAVKHAAISGEKLLKITERVMGNGPDRLTAEGNEQDAERFIAEHIRFKAAVVGKDERENAADIGPRSRKILNFGHTFGHALERATDYKRFRHGEAVGHGVHFAIELSKRLEILGQNEVNLLNDVIRRVGRLPDVGGIEPGKIISALGADKKNLGNTVQWILLKGIGKPVIIPQNQLPKGMAERAVKDYLNKNHHS